jgi:hypothetical protein
VSNTINPVAPATINVAKLTHFGADGQVGSGTSATPAASGEKTFFGGDWSVGRFFVPLLAPFYLLFSTGLAGFWDWAVGKIRFAVDSRYSWKKILGITVSGMLAIAVYLASSWNGEYGIYISKFDAGRATLARETMGRWLRANAPHGTLIAVDSQGKCLTLRNCQR